MNFIDNQFGHQYSDHKPNEYKLFFRINVSVIQNICPDRIMLDEAGSALRGGVGAEKDVSRVVAMADWYWDGFSDSGPVYSKELVPRL